MNSTTVPYTFASLRYVHDMVTQEFINMGVAAYSPAMRYLRVRCSTSYHRLTKAFGAVDGKHYRRLVNQIESAIFDVRDQFVRRGLEELPESIDDVLALALPRDDSSLRFSGIGGGLSSNLDETLDSLFDRYVDRYTKREEKEARSDPEVLRSFKDALAGRQIVEYIARPKTISSARWRHEFPWSWKNGVWTVCEPVSLDLVEEESIVDKAHRWEGRIHSLMEADPEFHSYLMLGEPSDYRLRSAYEDARAILARLPDQHRTVSESEASEFADSIQSAIPR